MLERDNVAKWCSLKILHFDTSWIYCWWSQIQLSTCLDGMLIECLATVTTISSVVRDGNLKKKTQNPGNHQFYIRGPKKSFSNQRTANSITKMCQMSKIVSDKISKGNEICMNMNFMGFPSYCPEDLVTIMVDQKIQSVSGILLDNLGELAKMST